MKNRIDHKHQNVFIYLFYILQTENNNNNNNKKNYNHTNTNKTRTKQQQNSYCQNQTKYSCQTKQIMVFPYFRNNERHVWWHQCCLLGLTWPKSNVALVWCGTDYQYIGLSTCFWLAINFLDYCYDRLLLLRLSLSLSTPESYNVAEGYERFQPMDFLVGSWSLHLKKNNNSKK